MFFNVERSDLVTTRKELPAQKKVAKKGWAVGDNNYVVVSKNKKPYSYN
jgi:hypothetical protein